MKTYQSFKNFKGQKAVVRWFDNLSGEGMVRLENGSCVYVHYSAFEAAARDVWISLPNNGHNVECEVELIEDVTFRQVSKIRCPSAIVQPRSKGSI